MLRCQRRKPQPTMTTTTTKGNDTSEKQSDDDEEQDIGGGWRVCLVEMNIREEAAAWVMSNCSSISSSSVQWLLIRFRWTIVVHRNMSKMTWTVTTKRTFRLLNLSRSWWPEVFSRLCKQSASGRDYHFLSVSDHVNWKTLKTTTKNAAIADISNLRGALLSGGEHLH